MEQIYFIINPKAGNGNCLKIWKRLEPKLKNKNISYMAFFTEYPGHAKSIAVTIAARDLEKKY